jgi:hypothetical protein
MLCVVFRPAAPLAFLIACAAGACEPSGPSTATPVPGDDRRTEVTVFTDPPGATVLVDGGAVGVSPVTIGLNPGPHRLRATLSGYYPAQEVRIVVERGKKQSHTISLVPSH